VERAKIVQVITACGLLITMCLLCLGARTAQAISSPTSISLKTPISTEKFIPATQIALTATPTPSVISSSASQSSTWDNSTIISFVGVIVQALACF